jgi:hypothetical protein
MMAELVPRLRRFRELVITDEVAAGLVAMSPATIDRRLAPDRPSDVTATALRTNPAPAPAERKAVLDVGARAVRAGGRALYPF